MKEKISRMWRSGMALFLALCMVAGSVPAVAFAITANTKINYVSLGASNVNGYGMRGYLDEEVYDYPLKKDEVNIYGYKQNTPGSYPVLIADALNANISQLAISSMRAEEVRFLLDDSYVGDAYTDWRFCDVPGYTNRTSQNWFYLAGKLEWEARGNAGTPTQEEAVATLKQAYREAIAQADLITVDVGINNFGVYASNQIVSNMYENDLSKVSPEWAAAYEEGKVYALSLLQQYAGAALNIIPTETLEHMADTMAYALVGFCLSFDAIMEQINTLNPDAEVVVVSIQNLMHGLMAEMPGIDEELPFGDIFGALINAANVYTATVSPYAGQYYYADVRRDGHVEFFSDELLRYNGDPATLSQDMKDCFDVYDNDLYIKTRVQQFFVSALYGELGAQYITITPEQANDLLTFYLGTLDKSIKVAGMPVLDFLAAGKANQLPADMAGFYALYERALATAYDVMAEIMQDGLELNTMDATGFGQNFGPVEDALLGAFFGVLENAVGTVVADPDYSFDLDEVYPDGIYKTLAAQANLPEGFVNTVALMGIRTGIGNSFFGHPNGNGHEELKNKILAAMDNQITGKDVVTEEIKIALEDLMGILEEYGPDVAAQVWEQWVEYGYVDAVSATIAKLQQMYETRYTYYTEEALPAIEAAIENLNAEKDGLAAELANLKVQLEVKKAELEKVLAEQEIGSVTLPDIDINVDAPVHGTPVPDHECEVEGEGDQAELEAAIKDLEHAIATIELLIADVQADITAMVQLAVEIAAVVEELGTTLNDVAAVAEDIKVAFDAIAEVLTSDADKTLNAIVRSFESARDTALALANVLDLTVDAANVLVEDINAMIETVTVDAQALYEKVMNDLPLFIEQIPAEQRALIGLFVTGIQEGLAVVEDRLDEELVAELAALKAEYADDIIELKAQTQAQAQAILAMIDAKYGEATASIEAEIAAEKAAAEAMIAALEAELMGYQAELAALAEDAAEEVRQTLQAQIDRVTRDIDTVKADLECALEHLNNDQLTAYEEVVEELLAELQEMIDNLDVMQAVQDAIDAILSDADEFVEDMKAKFNEMIVDPIVELVEDLLCQLEDLFRSATTADLVVDNDFKYVAIGDESALPESYVEKLAATLNAEAAENGVNEIEVVNNAKAGNTVAAERANLSDVTDADLVTIGFSNVSFLNNAVQGTVPMNWSSIVGEENVPYIDQMMSEVEAELAASGMSGDMIATISELIEAFAYSAVEYAVELPELINDIHAANPDALVVIVGMYNPFEGASVVVDGASVEIGKYADFLVEGVAAHGIAYSLITGNSIYVDARDIATANTDTEITLMELLAMAYKGFDVLYPTDIDNDYTAEQIFNALNITYVGEGLLGDANTDGIVDSYDAALILQYDVGAIGAEDLDLTVCDVSGDDIVDSYDATLILQYDVGMITEFPAAA